MDESEKPKLLLHICCAGCGAYVSQKLKDNFDVCLFFYNPNIFPYSEYEQRLEDVRKISERYKIELLVGEYEHKAWLKKIKDYENEPEKGKRCEICYFDRLELTAQTAKSKKFDFFTTTLTVSPHKLANKIIEMGKELSQKYEVEFLPEDFKKKNGFKEASALSKRIGLYRQNYCGCEFSRR